MRDSHLGSGDVTFTEQQLALLRKHWPAPEVVPGGCRERLMYAAGADAVIKFIERRTAGFRKVQI